MRGRCCRISRIWAITDCYSSPILQATAGSTHGYDICDHSRLNTELGTEDGLRGVVRGAPGGRFRAHRRYRAESHGVRPGDEPVVAGRARERSQLAIRPLFRHRLGPGQAGTEGEGAAAAARRSVRPRARARRAAARASTTARCTCGISIATCRSIRGSRRGCWGSISSGSKAAARAIRRCASTSASSPRCRTCRRTPSRMPTRIVERQREKEVARERLVRLVAESPPIAEHIDAAVARGQRHARRSSQFRPAPRAARASGLSAGLLAHRGRRNQLPAVLRHQRAGRPQDGRAGGVRGHPLPAPPADCGGPDHRAPRRSSRRAVRSGRLLPAPAADWRVEARPGAAAPFYVVAEKILSAGESLRADWPVAGTTGYGFLNLVSGLFIDGRHARELRRIYSQLTGRQRGVRRGRLREQAHHHADRDGERAQRAGACAQPHLRTRPPLSRFHAEQLSRGAEGSDRLLPGLSHATSAPRASTRSTARRCIEGIAHARRRNPLMEASIFDFLEEILLTAPDAPASTRRPIAQERWRVGDEGAAIHRPGAGQGHRGHRVLSLSRRSISANDVGGHPGRLGVTPAEFHEANPRRLESWPGEMITTATHDTKRGEDARMRINVLSEMPEALAHGRRRNGCASTAGIARRVGGVWAPDRNDEYLFYQALLGVWPAEPAPAPVPERAPADLVARISALHAEGRSRGEGAYQLDRGGPRVRPRGDAVRRTDARGTHVDAISSVIRPVATAVRRRRAWSSPSPSSC